jgi:hypothetical protein
MMLIAYSDTIPDVLVESIYRAAENFRCNKWPITGTSYFGGNFFTAYDTPGHHRQQPLSEFIVQIVRRRETVTVPQSERRYWKEMVKEMKIKGITLHVHQIC